MSGPTVRRGCGPSRLGSPMAICSAQTASLPSRTPAGPRASDRTCFESPANNVGPWPASLGCTTNSYSSINPSSVNARGSLTPPTNSPFPGSLLSLGEGSLARGRWSVRQDARDDGVPCSGLPCEGGTGSVSDPLRRRWVTTLGQWQEGHIAAAPGAALGTPFRKNVSTTSPPGSRYRRTA